VVIIGFNVRPEARAADVAKQEAVDIRLHSIIYKVEEEIRAAMIGMLEAIEKEKILGKAAVREVFRVPRAGTVAGCMVVDGCRAPQRASTPHSRRRRELGRKHRVAAPVQGRSFRSARRL
jgi:translation initiation factor IF-2